MIRREFRCYYEGEQEKKYFEHIAKIVHEINPNISIKFKQLSKLNVLDKSSTDVSKIAVFDFDSNRVEFEKKSKNV